MRPDLVRRPFAGQAAVEGVGHRVEERRLAAAGRAGDGEQAELGQLGEGHGVLVRVGAKGAEPERQRLHEA
jgi:hypothetical protein